MIINLFSGGLYNPCPLFISEGKGTSMELPGGPELRVRVNDYCNS